MGLALGLLWLLSGFLRGAHGQGVYGKAHRELRAPTRLRGQRDVTETHRVHQLDLVRDLARARLRVCACLAQQHNR